MSLEHLIFIAMWEIKNCNRLVVEKTSFSLINMCKERNWLCLCLRQPLSCFLGVTNRITFFFSQRITVIFSKIAFCQLNKNLLQSIKQYFSLVAIKLILFSWKLREIFGIKVEYIDFPKLYTRFSLLSVHWGQAFCQDSFSYWQPSLT